jgi:hypothetical protein
MRKEYSGFNGSLSVSQYLFIPKNGEKIQDKIIYIIHENCKKWQRKITSYVLQCKLLFADAILICSDVPEFV